MARVLLAAVHKPSPNSPFSILSRCPDVLPIIYAHLRHAWSHAIIPQPACVTPNGILRYSESYRPLSHHERSRVALCYVERLLSPFPQPNGLYCNMLPFLSNDFNTIPPEYHGYLEIIEACAYHVAEPKEPVWYLTIHESKLEPGRPQRRAGLHVEGFLAKPSVSVHVPEWLAWGINGSGHPASRFDGGIYHISSAANSCHMWNAQIPRASSDVLHVGCDVEHLRGVLTDVVEPVVLGKNEVYWFTDATPHESLPCDEQYRQYCRLVVGKISAWWEKHSTPNRLGVQPACRILKHDKFGKDVSYAGFDTDDTAAGGNTAERPKLAISSRA